MGSDRGHNATGPDSRGSLSYLARLIRTVRSFESAYLPEHGCAGRTFQPSLSGERSPGEEQGREGAPTPLMVHGTAFRDQSPSVRVARS
jgi:hypothetical protein